MSVYGDSIVHVVSLRNSYIHTESPPTLAGSAEIILSASVWLVIDVCGGGGLFDELGCLLRVGHVGHMAGIDFDRLGAGALRHHPLLLRIDRSVLRGHHVPGGQI